MHRIIHGHKNDTRILLRVAEPGEQEDRHVVVPKGRRREGRTKGGRDFLWFMPLVAIDLCIRTVWIPLCPFSSFLSLYMGNGHKRSAPGKGHIAAHEC